jgi:2-polyprenyl-3-methyl-5-hydroxy-6-metoxy-1,4-benzoquinol methylase
VAPGSRGWSSPSLAPSAAGKASVYRDWQTLDAADLDATRAREVASFDDQYRRETKPPRSESHATFVGAITPPHLPGGSPGGLTHRRAWEILTARPLAGRPLLDYGCGLGKWSIRLAQEGADVSGFDLSPVAVDTARRRAAFNQLPIRFDVADATSLPYADETFDTVVGVGVMHHVIKYPGTATELHRVMRPGGVAVFTETLAHNPLIELGRSITMRGNLDAGDVALTLDAVEEWGAPFAATTVEPFSLTYMVKAVIGRRPLLRACYELDTRLLRAFPALGRYCGECVVVLTR